MHYGLRLIERCQWEFWNFVSHFIHTRSYAALWAADLDWIIGPGSSFWTGEEGKGRKKTKTSRTRGHN